MDARFLRGGVALVGVVVIVIVNKYKVHGVSEPMVVHSTDFTGAVVGSLCGAWAIEGADNRNPWLWLMRMRKSVGTKFRYLPTLYSLACKRLQLQVIYIAMNRPSAPLYFY